MATTDALWVVCSQFTQVCLLCVLLTFTSRGRSLLALLITSIEKYKFRLLLLNKSNLESTDDIVVQEPVAEQGAGVFFVCRFFLSTEDLNLQKTSDISPLSSVCDFSTWWMQWRRRHRGAGSLLRSPEEWPSIPEEGSTGAGRGRCQQTAGRRPTPSSRRTAAGWRRPGSCPQLDPLLSPGHRRQTTGNNVPHTHPVHTFTLRRRRWESLRSFDARLHSNISQLTVHFRIGEYRKVSRHQKHSVYEKHSCLVNSAWQK